MNATRVGRPARQVAQPRRTSDRVLRSGFATNMGRCQPVEVTSLSILANTSAGVL